MIAVPITAKTVEKALLDIKEANGKADAIELRLDFLQTVNETILRELLDACTKPVIVTFRQQNFGASVEPTERMFILKKAIDFNAHCIDLDVDADKEFLADLAARKKNTRIILSHHNFEETRPLPELLEKMNSMLSLGVADIIKIVTFANAEQDNDTVLALVQAGKQAGQPVIAFCMGPKGKKSRIESIRMGAVLAFAALSKGKKSAPGQLSVGEMKKELGDNG